MAPRVSVCVPAYRAERFIGRAIQSVIEQTYSDWEMVILDDLSDDETVAAAREYERADPRIRVVANPTNQRPPASWNATIALTSAPFVKLLCSDDELLPQCLELQLARFDADDGPLLGMVAGRRDLVAADGTVLRASHGLVGIDRNATSLDRTDLARAMLRTGTNPLGEPSATLIRRDVLNEIGGFASGWQYMVDLATYAELARVARIGLVRDTVATFRISSGQWSTALARQQATEARCLLRDVAAQEGLSRAMLVRGAILARGLQTARRIMVLRSNRRSVAERPLPTAMNNG